MSRPVEFETFTAPPRQGHDHPTQRAPGQALLPGASGTECAMAKILCVLYDDPVTGYPPTYARDAVPTIDRYPGGQTVPSPAGIDFSPAELLGSVSGALGLRRYLERPGHTLRI